MNEAAVEEEVVGEEAPSSELVPVTAQQVSGYGLEHAERMVYALEGASKVAPVRQWRYLLAGQAEEWEQAHKGLAECLDFDGEGIAVIEMAATLVKAMKVWIPTMGWMQLTRTLKRDGDYTLVLKITHESQLSYTGNKREIYENLLGAESPVVVMA